MACTFSEDVLSRNNKSDTFIGNYSNSFTFRFDFEEDPKSALYNRIEKTINTKVVLWICAFGIIGNILNLVILTRKSITTKMAKLEQSAHYGLVALAVSDLLFCLAALPHTMNDSLWYETSTVDFWLLYEAYGEAVVNMFLLSSTWLTVAMAVSRYIAICYPLRARSYLGLKPSKCIMVMVFIFSVVFNLPRFFKKRIKTMPCTEGGNAYYTEPGHLSSTYNEVPVAVYKWMYFILGILLPLIILSYCNIFLIRTLRKSMAMRQQLSSGQEARKSQKNQVIVTLTLIIIVVLYLVLVVPAELMTFWQPYVQRSYDSTVIMQYSLALVACNMLQSLNFAVNFALYCIINVHFRKTIKDILCCTGIREGIAMRRRTEMHEDGTDMYSALYTANTEVSTAV